MTEDIVNNLNPMKKVDVRLQIQKLPLEDAEYLYKNSTVGWIRADAAQRIQKLKAIQNTK